MAAWRSWRGSEAAVKRASCYSTYSENRTIHVGDVGAKVQSSQSGDRRLNIGALAEASRWRSAPAIRSKVRQALMGGFVASHTGKFTDRG